MSDTGFAVWNLAFAVVVLVFNVVVLAVILSQRSVHRDE
jgi:hypothetical protein